MLDDSSTFSGEELDPAPKVELEGVGNGALPCTVIAKSHQATAIRHTNRQFASDTAECSHGDLGDTFSHVWPPE
jgi:hypothetical protein